MLQFRKKGVEEMMKKAEDQTKKKRMQLVASFGMVALIALGALAIGMLNPKEGKVPEQIDLNATPTPGAPKPTEMARQETPEDKKTVVPTMPPAKQPDSSGERQQRADAAKAGTELSDESQVADAERQPEETGTPVLSMDGVLDSLNFSAETGMLWPVTGEALIAYSPEHAIYHKTLDSYRTSNYVLLGGEVGTHVSAAADGVVTSVKEELKTGTTVTMQVSANHEIVYGMLADVTVREGDYVKEGTVFASVAEPTRYYVEDGSGVYVQVLENEEAVNPMLFLK